jgi:hypothetical protein
VTAPPSDSARPPRRTRPHLNEYFPWPLVGVVVLLVVLILVTPILLSTSGPPAAGTIFTQARLLVDRAPGHNVTNLYVEAEEATVRYASIVITWAHGFNWSGSGAPAWATLNWSVGLNASQVLAVTFPVTSNPVAINVTALYNENGVAYYVGVFALYVSNATAPTPDTMFAVTPTPGVSIPSTIPLSSLPVIVPLADVGSGGP